jgi:hypothetical protein
MRCRQGTHEAEKILGFHADLAQRLHERGVRLKRHALDP